MKWREEKRKKITHLIQFNSIIIFIYFCLYYCASSSLWCRVDCVCVGFCRRKIVCVVFGFRLEFRAILHRSVSVDIRRTTHNFYCIWSLQFRILCLAFFFVSLLSTILTFCRSDFNLNSVKSSIISAAFSSF